MEEKEIEIDILQLLNAILSRIGMITAVTVMCGAFAFAFSKFAMTPMYTANTTMYVNSQTTVMSESININEINASTMMADVFVELLCSKTIMNEVIKQTKLDYTTEELASMITANSVQETPIMIVSVTTPNPKESVVIANAILDIAPEKMIDFMDGGSVRIVDRPDEPTVPSSPNIPKNTIIGLLLGFMLSAGIVILIEMLDSRIKDEEQIRNLFDLPVLGSIPKISVDDE